MLPPDPASAEPVVVFRTHSDVEASIVRGLLDAHGITAALSSDVPHSLFPLSVDGLGEVRITVSASDAEAASRLIADYRQDDRRGAVIPLRDEFVDLESAIGYRFRDRGVLEHALTHRSRAHEDVTGGVFDNESLEFLGDAILGFVVADLLFRRYPDRDEGQKSKMKATLVSASTLAERAERLELGRHLILGRGEEKSGGRRKLALLADGYEAVIAAVYSTAASRRRESSSSGSSAISWARQAGPGRSGPTTSRRSRSRCRPAATPCLNTLSRRRPDRRIAGCFTSR